MKTLREAELEIELSNARRTINQLKYELGKFPTADTAMTGDFDAIVKVQVPPPLILHLIGFWHVREHWNGLTVRGEASAEGETWVCEYRTPERFDRITQHEALKMMMELHEFVVQTAVKSLASTKGKTALG